MQIIALHSFAFVRIPMAPHLPMVMYITTHQSIMQIVDCFSMRFHPNMVLMVVSFLQAKQRASQLVSIGSSPSSRTT